MSQNNNVSPFIRTEDPDLALIHPAHILGLSCNSTGGLVAFTSAAIATRANVVLLRKYESQEKCVEARYKFIASHWRNNQLPFFPEYLKDDPKRFSPVENNNQNDMTKSRLGLRNSLKGLVDEIVDDMVD